MQAPNSGQQSSSSVERESFLSRSWQIAREALGFYVHFLQWLARKFQLPRWSRRRLAVSAALLFAASTGGAVYQFLQPFVWHEPYALFGRQWWYHPLEWNLDSALPSITGSINGVFATPGPCLWIAGASGLLAFSRDLGQSWTQLHYDSSIGDFRAPTGARPCGGPNRPNASQARFSLVPVVFAHSEDDREQPSQSGASPNLPVQPQSSTAPNTKSRIGQISPSAKGNFSKTTQAAPEKALQVFPAAVDFGSAIVGSTGYIPALASLHVKNLGQAPISISRITLSPTVFQRDPKRQDSCSDQMLYPGKECVVPLLFEPTKVGEIRGQLSLSSDAQPEPWIVGLHGIGEQPRSSPAVQQSSAYPTAPGKTSGTRQPNRAANPPARVPPRPAVGSSVSTTTPPSKEAPDLWGFYDSRSDSGRIYANHGDSYSSQNGGLLWTRSLFSSEENSPTINLADKQLQFERESKSGAYRLNAVTGRSRTANLGAMQWDSTNRSFYAFTLNSKGAVEGKMLESSKPDGEITAISFADISSARFGWAINYAIAASGSRQMRTSQILYTSDGARTWSVLKALRDERLKSVHFQNDGKTGWVAGDNGVLLSTVDAGTTWHPLTVAAGHLLSSGQWSQPGEAQQYVRFISPWYLLALMICGVLATPVLFPVEQAEVFGPAMPELKPSPSVAGAREADASAIGNQAIADKPLEPGDPDALGLGTIAAGLAFFLRNQKTKPPLAIAINGRWGSGKTSLMNLLKSDLEAWGAHPVWFNAWHHQKEDQMLAALLQAVKTQGVPPIWQILGLAFRFRLAWRRLQRSWVYLVLLAAAIAVIYKVDVFLNISALSLVTWISSGKTSTDVAAKLAGTPIITILTAAAAVYKIVSSGLTAFGTNPASLLASVSGGRKIKDLDAQTGFRQRFASEFKDVTLSLGQNQRMLVLIDDLDRCRPEKVREVLEGVNFLASSGDCFIVLGMARDIVEHCVGLSFASVVDTMSWEAMGLTPNDVARAYEEASLAVKWNGVSAMPVDFTRSRPIASLETHAKRHAYAHLYLDKLIQIEVSVPEPTPLQRRLLFRSDEEIQREWDRNERRVQEIMSRSRAIYAGAQPVMAGVLAGLVLFGIWTLTRSTLRSWALGLTSATASKTDRSAGATTVPRGSNSRATSADSGGASTGTASSAGANSAAEASPMTQLHTSPGGVFPYGAEPAQLRSPTIEEDGAKLLNTGWTAEWPFYLLGVAAVSLVAASLRRLPQRIVRDEAPFTNALSIWHPLVMTGGAKNTPRTARRFQNRVRYLAMRQRALLRGKSMSLGERWLRDGLHAPMPQLDRPVHLAESEDIPLALVRNAQQVRALVETGQNGRVGSWSVIISADRVQLLADPPTDIREQEFKALVLGNVYIPEPVLVALAAIEEYAPEWILDEHQFQTNVVDPTVSSVEERSDMLAKILKEHCQHWDNWHNLEQYRRAYLSLSSEVTRSEIGRAQSAG